VDGLPARVTTELGIEFHVTEAVPADQVVLYKQLNRILSAGEGYPQAGPISFEEFREYWLDGKTVVVVARRAGSFVGSYFLKPNGYGRAAHIANGGYFVVPEHRKLGAGEALVRHSMLLAPALGFDALQFNFVFESNLARRPYERLGFEVVGRVPEVIDGEAVYIYWRPLT
jgi:ribosomal protein S18 acetylase RimI-like enzyme